MALTKPAGCFLQLLALPMMLGGCIVITNGLGPGGSGFGTTFLGFVLMIAGAALLVVGRKPATKE